jgi:hypothetical protein
MFYVDSDPTTSFHGFMCYEEKNTSYFKSINDRNTQKTLHQLRAVSSLGQICPLD